MASVFAGVEGAPPIEIFALMKAYKEDTFVQKVDLGVGGKNPIENDLKDLTACVI